ncbi:MAG: HEAT repeat domain-containing protein [Actinomycetia bacterium]|nr:HEAT repeat domain-containing protein [Actinomycetes bacterium]
MDEVERNIQKLGRVFGRKKAARALGEIGDPRAVEPLVRSMGIKYGWRVLPGLDLMDYGGAYHTKEARDALVRIGEPAVEPLVPLLRDKESIVRDEAARALGEIGDPRAVEALIGALGDKDWHVRHTALKIFPKIGKSAVEPLIWALEDKDKMVRDLAAWALGKIGDPRAVEPLTRALGDENEDIRKTAKKALKKIQKSRLMRKPASPGGGG